MITIFASILAWFGGAWGYISNAFRDPKSHCGAPRGASGRPGSPTVIILSRPEAPGGPRGPSGDPRGGPGRLLGPPRAPSGAPLDTNSDKSRRKESIFWRAPCQPACFIMFSSVFCQLSSIFCTLVDALSDAFLGGFADNFFKPDWTNFRTALHIARLLIIL